MATPLGDDIHHAVPLLGRAELPLVAAIHAKGRHLVATVVEAPLVDQIHQLVRA